MLTPLFFNRLEMSHRRSWKKLLSPFIPKLLTCIQEGYTLKILRGDLLAGLTVGIVALPVAMAFGIASGVAPAKGLFTSIVAGFLISFLGGSRVQISGAAGALVAVLYVIVEKQGYEAMVFATLLAGVILILSGFARLGNLIKYIPSPLIVGFTSGIAVTVFSSQLGTFLGFRSLKRRGSSSISGVSIFVMRALGVSPLCSSPWGLFFRF